MGEMVPGNQKNKDDNIYYQRSTCIKITVYSGILRFKIMDEKCRPPPTLNFGKNQRVSMISFLRGPFILRGGGTLLKNVIKKFYTLRSLFVEEDHIGPVVSKILRYTEFILLLLYNDFFRIFYFYYLVYKKKKFPAVA